MKSFRWLTLSALVVCMVLFSFSLSVPRTISSARNSNHADILVAAQPAISATIGKDNVAYHFQATDAGWVATHAQQNLTAHLTDAGATIEANDAHLGLRLVAYGYGDVLAPAIYASPQANANRVEYLHTTNSAGQSAIENRKSEIVEWYVNGPVGLEQGFTVNDKLQSTNDKLTLALALDTNLPTTVDADGAGLALMRADGTTALRYAGLTAFDATGKALRAWMEIGKGEVTSPLQIHVDTANAQYPITIDPWIQTAKLTASDGVGGDRLGYSVAISGDTIVVGAYAANVATGAAYVFVKPPSGWWSDMTQTAKLTASDGAAYDDFGYSVAISGDTIVVGAYNKNSATGVAYVFVKPSGGWNYMNQTAKLTASDGATGDYFGYSVSVSGDTVVVGAYLNNSHKGATYVFVKPTGGWSDLTQTAKLTASDGANTDFFSYSVAISGDTVIAGAYKNNSKGSAYVFVKPTGGWSDMTQTAKLTPFDGLALDNFGWSVAISGDTVVVGMYNSSYPRLGRAAYVFVKPAGGWSNMTQTAKLTPSDATLGFNFGNSVAISGDTITVAPGSGAAVYVFAKPTGGWTGMMTETAKLTASNTTPAFGWSAAISGTTVVVSDYGSDYSIPFKGAAYVFWIPPDPVYVDSYGSCGGNVPCYTSLTAGITAAMLTGNVIAYPGMYNESVNVSKNITVTLSGAMFYLNGSLTQSAGIFNAPSTSLYLTGNLARTGGTFNHNNGTFIFAGSGTQTVTGNFTFNHLTVDSTALVDVGANVLTVNNTLTNNGVMKRSAPALAVTTGGGKVAYIDPVNKVTAQLTSTGATSLGNTSIVITTHQSPGGGTVSCGATTLGGTPVLRHYNITPQNTSGVAATVRLYFTSTEAYGNSIANLGLYHCDGTTWTRLTGTPVTGTDATSGYSYIELTNVTSFSPFAISGGPGAPTAVTLSSFDARPGFDLGAWFAELLRRVKR